MIDKSEILYKFSCVKKYLCENCMHEKCYTSICPIEHINIDQVEAMYQRYFPIFETNIPILEKNVPI